MKNKDIINYDFKEERVQARRKDHSTITPKSHSKIRTLVYNEIDKTDHGAIAACDIQTCGFNLNYEIEFFALYKGKSKWQTIYQGNPEDFLEQSKVKAKIKNPPNNTHYSGLPEETNKRRYFNICSILLALETPKKRKQLLAQKRIVDIDKEKEKLTKEQRELENIINN